MHSEGKLPLARTPPLMVKRMVATDEGQRPHLASFSPTMRSIIINVGIRASRAKAEEMTL